MQIDDVERFTPDERQSIIDSYPGHEPRVRGIPSLVQVACSRLQYQPLRV
jgi:hypothetical protein